MDVGHARGFKGVIALRGATALSLARKFQPAAVTLDIGLPDLDGWKVLDALKHDPSTRHIPVHIISVDDRLQTALGLGAVGGLTKPVTKKSLAQAFDLLESFVNRPSKNLLVVEHAVAKRTMIVQLIGNGDVQTTTVSSGAEALAALDRQNFDCMVLDLDLPHMTGFELIAHIKQSARVPVPIVVYGSKEFTGDEETQLRALSETVIVKDVRSVARLLDETALFLHRVRGQAAGRQTPPPGANSSIFARDRRQEAAYRRRRPAQPLRADERARTLPDAYFACAERSGSDRVTWRHPGR